MISTWSRAALLIALVLQIAGEDPLDVHIIYRFHEVPPMTSMDIITTDSSNGTVEYHARTNGLGRLLYHSNGSLLDPNIGTPALDCVHAAFDCAWQNKGWTTDFLHKFPENTNLTFHMTDLMETSVLCPPGYILMEALIGGFTCKAGSCDFMLFGFLGVLTSPNFPSNYDNNIDCKWLIYSFPAQRVTLSFTSFSTESCCDRVEVYDGDSISDKKLGSYSGSAIPDVIISEGNKMLITFHSDGGSTYSGFEAVYNMELGVVSFISYIAAVEEESSGKMCGSCYGAEAPDICCNTCDEVKDAYSRKKWALGDINDIEQCSRILSQLAVRFSDNIQRHKFRRIFPENEQDT